MSKQKQDAKSGSRGEQQGSQQQQRSLQRGGGQWPAGGLSRQGQFMPMMATSPFSLMRRFNEDIGRLFQEFLLGGTAMGPRARGTDLGLLSGGLADVGNWAPDVDVFEREGQLIVRAAMPGIDKEEVRVEIRDDAIVLRGEEKEEREEDRGDYYVREMVRGSFYREIPLPEGVNTDNATATFRNGVLEIVIPEARGQTRSRQLEVSDATPSGQQAQGATGGAEGRAAGAAGSAGAGGSAGGGTGGRS
jgi:HSP20 family protein